MTIRDIAIAFGYEINKQSEKKVENSIGNLKKMAKSALGAIGVGISLVKANALIEEFTQVNQTLKNVVGEAENFAEVQNEVLGAANNTMTAYSTMSSYVGKLMNTQNSLFSSVEGTLEFAELTTKAMKAAGANESTIASLNNGIQSAFTTGKVSAGTFQSLMESCPQSVEYLAETLGISERQVKALGQAGAITSNQLYSAFSKNANDINKAYENVAFKISDATTYIRNNFGLWLTDLNETLGVTKTIAKTMVRGFDVVLGVLKKVTSFVEKLNNKLGGSHKTLKLFAIVGGSLYGLLNADKMLGFFKTLSSFISVGTGKLLLIAAAVVAVALVVEDFIEFLKGNDSITAQFFESIGVDAEEMRNSLLGVLKECKESLTEAWEEIKGAFGEAWEAIKPALKELVYMLINIITQLLPPLCNLLSAVARIFASIAKAILPVLTQILTKVIDIFTKLVDKILPVITDLINKLLPIIETFINEVLPVLADFISDIINLVLDVIDEILPILIDLVGTIVSVLADGIGQILPVIAELIKTILPLLVDIIDSILPIIVDLIKQLLPFIMTIIREVLPVIFDLLKQIIPVITEIISKILPIIVKLLDALMPILSKLLSSILGPILDLILAIVPVITEIVEAILPVLIELIDIIVPILEMVIELLMPILDMVLSLIGPLLQMITDILKPILGLITSIIAPLLELVMSILRPLFDIITALLEPLFTIITAVLEPLIDVLKTLFGIVAPFITILVNLLGSVLHPIISVLTTLADVLGGILGGAVSKVTDLLKPLLDILSKVLGFVGDLLGGALGGVADVVGNVVSGIGGVVGGVVSGVSNAVGGVVSGIGSIFGLAEGGYIGANNPTPVVIGDNTQEGEIVSPISKMRNTVLDALNLFSSASVPTSAASTLSNESSNRVLSQTVNITNTFNGGSADQQKNGARAMRKSADDATGIMARGLAYAR